MFGAVPWLQKAFPVLSKEQARKVFSEWMQTFNAETDS